MRPDPAELGGEHVLGGELTARAAQSTADRLGGARELGGQLAVRLAVEDSGENRALVRGQRGPGRADRGELLAYQQDAQRVAVDATGHTGGQVVERARRDGTRRGVIQRRRSAEHLVLVRAGGTERGGRLGVHAVDGERCKRPASRLPSPDRSEQRDPGFLGDVCPLAAAREPQAADDRGTTSGS